MPEPIARWVRDIATLSPETPPGRVERLGGRLWQQWSEPHRYYHDTTHLIEVLHAVDTLAQAGELDEHGGALARTAAWYHDAVYQASAAPGANESASAGLAGSTLTDLGVPAAEVEIVQAMVLASQRHDGVAGDGALGAFIDADLWILSASAERFDAYCAQIRREYSVFADPDYRAGRTAVLTPLLNRPTIYRTAHARAQWEPAARRNLRAELGRLADLPSG